MKRAVISFAFALVFLTTFAFAMEGPVTVQTEPGNRVKVYTWIPNGESQALFELREGIADEAGVYQTTFFSLNEPSVKYQVRILSGKVQVRDGSFEDFGVDNALLVNCAFENCVMSIDDSWVPEGEELFVPFEETSEEVVEEPVLEEPVEEREVAVEEEPIVEDLPVEEVGEVPATSPISGASVITKDDGSVNWLTIGILAAVLVLLVGGLIMFFNKRGGRTVQVMNPTQRELKATERQVRKVESQIKQAKGDKELRDRIFAAKAKLAQEQKELKELMSGGAHPEKISEQKEAVEDAKDELKEHKSKS